MLVQGEAAFAESDGVSSADIVNADKMSGRSRKYKIIFSPQKVVSLCSAATYPIVLLLPDLCAFHPSYRHQQFFVSD